MTATTTTERRRTRRWTYADYCRIPPDGRRHEVIDGRHFVNPAPSPYHQFVSGALFAKLRQLVQETGRGLVLDAPVDVHLGPGTIVQPDLVVLRGRTRPTRGEKKITGVPDLLVEILSPGNRTYDRRTKRDRYERAGVREFWLVDPDTRTIEQLVLHRGRYAKPVVAGEQIMLRALRGITIDLREVW